MECLKIQTSISSYRIFAAFPIKMYIERFKQFEIDSQFPINSKWFPNMTFIKIYHPLNHFRVLGRSLQMSL